MGYHKQTVVSLFTCALLILTLLTPYVTATYLTHHAQLNQTDLEAGDVDVPGPSTRYMPEGIYVPEVLASYGASSTSSDGDTPGNRSNIHDLDLLNLNSLFPEGHIPSNSSGLQYGLITLGAGSKPGAVDTDSSGSGYLLAIGESHGLAQLQKRDGQPDPFVFLDCPANVLDQPVNQTQKARVVCTSEDVDGCFRVKERGVEGTLVEMPDECAPNSFARAISLELAEDQTMPDHLAGQHNATSPIYEFSFDFNKHEGRDDAKVAIRIDMTNVNGHWDGLVDSPGVEKRDVEGKYLTSLNLDWKKAVHKGNTFQDRSGDGPYRVKKDLTTPVFWQAADNCPAEGKFYGEGIGAYIQGHVDANLFYAMTVIATSTRGSRNVNVTEAHGFMHVKGQTDLTFRIGGLGRLDIAMAGKGNPAKSQQFYESFTTNRISAGALWGTMRLTPFIRRQSYLATSHMDEPSSSIPGHGVVVGGVLGTRVKTDLGGFPASFPRIQTPGQMDTLRRAHKKIEMESFINDALVRDGGEKGSTIQIGHDLDFGLGLSFDILPDIQGRQPVYHSSSANLYVTSETQARWDIPAAENDKVCPHASATSLLRQWTVGKDLFGWNESDGSAELFTDTQAAYHKPCYSTKTNIKRSIEDFAFPGNQSTSISTKKLDKREIWRPKHLEPVDIWGYIVAWIFRRGSVGKINCKNGRCASCVDFIERDGCCGCVCMQCIWGPRRDIPPCEKCTDEVDHSEAPWPGTHVKRDRISGHNVPAHEGEGWVRFLKNAFSVRARTITPGWKDVKVHGVSYDPPNPGNSAQFKYPKFPQDVKKVWEGADGGIYDSISYYWGNTSADCSDWSLGLNRTRDQTLDPQRGWIPSPYETEHVYEGQNLGQFFTEWLTEGQIKRQTPHPGITKGKVDKTWVENWIMSPGEDLPWTNPVDLDEEFSLFGLLHSELGNNYHKDRLAILLARLNRKKENVFDLSKSYSEHKYRYKMTHDQQWSTVKEMGENISALICVLETYEFFLAGLTFNYLNNDTIWGMWCDTYTGIYDWLEKFDDFYTDVKGPDDPDVSLAEEWGKYNRVVLDSAVKINGDGWDWTFENRQ
ncbi:hypothetical protein FVER53590_04351 [Fusarium verticillioides]|nr:hypothetical protein FVER53590_04351 [Fusarium verticillioides]